MTIESSQLREHHRDTMSDHLDQLRAGNPGIDTVTDYLEAMDVFEETGEEKDDFLFLDDDYDPGIFFRCFPENGQQVMLSTVNPGLRCSPNSDDQNGFDRSLWEDKPEGDHWYPRFQRAGGDPSSIAKEGANNLPRYFANKTRPQQLINDIRDSISSLTSDNGIEEYLQRDAAAAYRKDPENQPGVDLSSGFFDEIYYSPAFKMATPNEDYISKIDSESSYESRFREEVLEIVQPDILITAGGRAWHAIFDAMPEEEEVIAHNDSNFTQNYYWRKKGGPVPGVFEIPSEDLVVVTAKQPGRHGKYEKFRENLEIAESLI